MSSFLTPLAAEIAAPTSTGTASTVGDNRVIRCVNTNSSNGYLVSLQDTSGNLKGSMSLAPAESAIIFKNSDDEIFAANANVKLTPVTYPRG